MIDENAAPEESPNSFVQSMTAKEAHRLATRPVIDDLVDAVVKDELGRMVLLARPGEKLIVERFATILPGRPWLDTKTYTVQSVDEATGRVNLWDDDLQRYSFTDYVAGTRAGFRFKLPVKGRRITSQRKRGRPRKVVPVTSTPAVVQQPTNPDGTPAKRGRGRPKGAKNRDREVIAAEKKAKAAERRAKLDAKKAGKVAKKPK